MSVTMEPMLSPSVAFIFTTWRSLMPCRLTTRLGEETKSLVRSNKSVPPAKTSASFQLLPRSFTAPSFVVGLANSKGCISPVLPLGLLESFQYFIRGQRQRGHADANGVRDCIGNGRARRN